MKKIMLAIGLTTLGSLAAATAVLLATPVPAVAATCSVTCSNGDVLTCTGVTCGVSPGVGCFATTQSGISFGMLCLEEPPPWPPPPVEDQ
jgi:hypothetical protein